MKLSLFNTASRSLEDFQPQDSKTALLYTCGPTVYAPLHLGNWSAYVRWDTLVRSLRLAGFEVRRVMNITDVGHLVSDADEGEDKMEAGARREGQTAWQVAERYIADFIQGMADLQLTPPQVLARATDYIPQQIALIERLAAKGHTYIIDDGVYFDTATFKPYADFARLDLHGQHAGARVTINRQKRHPADFALWKFSPAGKRRDMQWESPWGKGFPGWHLECSAIALHCLGETLDIHTGGIDHIPVHHTNEIAQSEATTGRPFARFWLHNNFLLLADQKISKSGGGGVTLQDLAGRGLAALDFKLFVLQSHYRSEARFSWELLTEAALRRHEFMSWAELRHQGFVSQKLGQQYRQSIAAFKNQLGNDLNTPAALAELNKMLKRVDELGADASAIAEAVEVVEAALGIGLGQTPDLNDEQKSLLAQRQAARQRSDWQRSDELRDKLASDGVIVKDAAYGQVWSRLRTEKSQA